MAIEWEETVETKRRVALVVDLNPSNPFKPDEVRDATIDDLRRACEAAGLVVETAEAAETAANVVEFAAFNVKGNHTSPRAAWAAVVDEFDALTKSRDEAVEQSAERDAAVAERDGLRARLEKAEARIATETARAEKAEASRSCIGEVLARANSDIAAAKEKLEASAESARLLTADLAAAKARIAELEAPMPEATITEIVDTFQRAERAHYRQQHNRFDHDAAGRAGIRAVAERVRRERPQCLIARAVAANIDVRVAEDVGGGFLVGIHRPGEDEHVVRNVPAAEVPATLARQLTEAGA